MSEPEPEVKLTFVASTTRKTTKLGRKLEQLAGNYHTREEKLLKKLQNKARTLAAKYQKQQHAAFEQLRVEMGISDADWGDGHDWVLGTENLADGMVALVHAADERYAVYYDSCDCLACQVRRAMTPGDREKPEVDPRRLH